MGKESLELLHKNSAKYLSNKNQNWTLVVGAGICSGIMPDWSILTLNVVNTCYGTTWDAIEFKSINEKIGFSFDSWIQASLNKYLIDGGDLDGFNKILEDELYKDLLIRADKHGIKETLINYMCTPRKKEPTPSIVIDFFETEYGNTTLLQIVRVLNSSPEKQRLPVAIITLNADILLNTLINALNTKLNCKPNQPLPEEPYKLVLRSYNMWSDKIPIFHLHGSIAPEQTHKVNPIIHDSRDNLIFLESTYTRVAGNMYSWAQSNFLFYSTNTTMVFIGLSMSDPNIRRWLNWAHEEMNFKLSVNRGIKDIAKRHLWIKPVPSDKSLVSFFENSLTHLGVKVGWINGYNEIEKALKYITKK